MAKASNSNSQSRAQLIREMSRDLNKTRHSSGSSRSSQGLASVEHTTSDFDPENEALMSTRQFDMMSQKLPELRASAQKYNRFARQERSETDFAINTSALGRAFPDFSSGGTSDGNSISIEIGRGHRNTSNGTIGKLGRSREYSPNPPASASEDSLDFKAPIVGSYQVVSTPPMRQRSTSMKKDDSTALRREAHVRRASLNRKQQAELLKKTSQEVLRNLKEAQKENIDPSPPPAKTTDYVSGGNGHKMGEERRTLAAMHARVRDEDDLSKINDERPPSIDLTTRSTRFGSGRNQPASTQESLPSKFSSAKDFMRTTTQKHGDSQQSAGLLARGAISSTPNPGTQQSFMLPDMPNLSELVSGVFQDGTPVFSRHGKSRASRFTSSSLARDGTTVRSPEHAAVGEIPVPGDENAIFISLRLLQDKVADLEKDRAETQNTIQDLQQRNQMLELEKADQKRRQRSDSALGSSDSGSDGDQRTGSSRKLIIEKNRLEASVRSLQSQLDASYRKASTFETVVNNITKERDSAVSQLGVVYFTIEQLKSENNALTTENQKLKDRVKQLTTSLENETQDWTTKEEYLRKQIQQTKESVRNLEEMSRGVFNGRKTSTGVTAGKGHRNTTEQFKSQETETQPYPRSAKRSKEVHKATGGNTEKAKPLTSPNQGGASGYRTNQKTKDLLRGIGPSNNDQTYHSQESDEFLDLAREEEELSRQSILQARSSSSRLARNGQGDDTSQDLTYLSFLKSDEVGKLRKTLELERIARKDQDAPRIAKDIAQEDASSQIAVVSQPILPRKSSMKDMTRRRSSPADRTEQSVREPTVAQEVYSNKPSHSTERTSNLSQATRPKSSGGEHMRRHSEPSIPITRRRSRSLGMTSPYLLPDITMRIPGIVYQPRPELSRARAEFADNKEHIIDSCTVCKGIMERGIDHDHNNTANESIKIPKPVPVSERVPQDKQYEDEPTVRPSQPPAVALAAVLKGLSDEHAHLIMQYSHYKSLYIGHDPSIMKTKRKDLWEKMRTLLNAMEAKADQIYALYDVLEGQKEDGNIDLEDKEVEETLQSVGIDLVELGLRGGETQAPEQKSQTAQRQPWDLDSNENSTQNLPWEGIESTVETFKSGQTDTRRRSWAA